jgi:type II secretory pathway component PulF
MRKGTVLQPTHIVAVIAVSLAAASVAALVVFCLVTPRYVEVLHDRGVVHLSPVMRLMIECSNFLTAKWYLLVILVGPVLVVLCVLAFARERGARHSPE